MIIGYLRCRTKLLTTQGDFVIIGKNRGFKRMNTHKISAILVLLLAFSILPASALAKYAGGLGTAENPYRIATAANLLTLAANTDDYDKYFVLTADIDLKPNLPGRRLFTTAVIAPDTDNSNDSFDGIPFTGVFDGAGHKIINLTIDANGAENDFLGLFGNSIGEIKNLTLENLSISGGDNSLFVGGLVGENDASISNCSSTGTIAAGDNSYYLGGLIGNNVGDVNGCSSAGTVTDGSNAYGLGGLVGENDGTISRCYSTVAVTGGDTSTEIGGLVGENVGSLDGTIINSYSTGAVTGGSDSSYLGGSVGYNGFGAVTNCYSSGDVNSGAGSTFLGGLMGDNGLGTVGGCYFLDTSGPDNSIGDPLTDEEMKQEANFVGWDFVGETVNGTEDIWWINEGDGYPTLVARLEITKCTVTAGATNSDRISFSGLMNAAAGNFSDINDIFVFIDSNDINTPCDQNFPVTSKTFKNGKYNYSGTVDRVRKSFTYDVKTRKFAFSAGNVDLSGLDCPVNIAIEIGNFFATARIDETIVNGPKVPIPILLMMGIKNTLRVDKLLAKYSGAPNSDQLSVKGAFAVQNIDPKMINWIGDDLVITLGAQTFTIPNVSLIAGWGKFTFSKVPVTEGDAIITGEFNFNTRSFILTLKSAEIEANPGDTVDFGVSFAGFDKTVSIVLPP